MYGSFSFLDQMEFQTVYYYSKYMFIIKPFPLKSKVVLDNKANANGFKSELPYNTLLFPYISVTLGW